jgi:hypothetical protein
VITSRWCGGGPATCAKAIGKTLTEVYDTLERENGTADVAKWSVDTALLDDRKATGDKHESMPQYDAIHFRALGIVGQPFPNWQNRPTFQQVIQFPAHRPARS